MPKRSSRCRSDNRHQPEKLGGGGGASASVRLQERLLRENLQRENLLEGYLRSALGMVESTLCAAAEDPDIFAILKQCHQCIVLAQDDLLTRITQTRLQKYLAQQED